ncbi:MAG: hypothetical protein ACYC35_05275 [Pirellulales bacterium]
MLRSWFLVVLATFATIGAARAQAPAPAPSGAWRAPRKSSGEVLAPGTAPRAGLMDSRRQDRQGPETALGRTTAGEPITQVSQGLGQLPNDAGQVWRDYDISPYTVRVSSTNRPEQAVVDWILRETGYEAWHGEPLAVLSANRRTLRVYHTPQMQASVAELVDRFVNSQAESHAFALRVITVDNPNWRARAQHVLRPVAVQTQGIEAWLLEKEDAALLLAELRKRNDAREYGSPHLLVNNGQSTAVAETRTRNYIRRIKLRSQWPGFEPETAQIDEGFSLELSPLLSLDGRTIDAVLKGHIDQVERLVPVMLDMPTAAAPRQRTKIEVPQTSQYRFQERFRWPVSQVLLVGLGVVAKPVPNEPNALVSALPLPLSAPRADLLVLVESKGQVAPSTPPREARR